MAKFAPFDAADYLDDEESDAEYITAALEDPNPEVFLAAVRDVARARGMAQLAAPLAPQADAPTTRTTAGFRMHTTTDWHDPVVAEIHTTRERLAAQYHNDLKT